MVWAPYRCRLGHGLRLLAVVAGWLFLSAGVKAGPGNLQHLSGATSDDTVVKTSEHGDLSSHSEVEPSDPERPSRSMAHIASSFAGRHEKTQLTLAETQTVLLQGQLRSPAEASPPSSYLDTIVPGLIGGALLGLLSYLGMMWVHEQRARTSLWLMLLTLSTLGYTATHEARLWMTSPEQAASLRLKVEGMALLLSTCLLSNLVLALYAKPTVQKYGLAFLSCLAGSVILFLPFVDQSMLTSWEHFSYGVSLVLLLSLLILLVRAIQDKEYGAWATTAGLALVMVSLAIELGRSEDVDSRSIVIAAAITAFLYIQTHVWTQRHILARNSEERLLRLGELFSDLSHELKNILQGASSLQGLQLQDAQLSSSALSLDDEMRDVYSQALLQPASTADKNERLLKLEGRIVHGDEALERVIRNALVDLQIDDRSLIQLWLQMRSMTVEELAFATSQIKIFLEIHQFQHMVRRSYQLTQSVLRLARHNHEVEQLDLAELWSQCLPLLRPRLHSLQISCDAKFPSIALAANGGGLMQILLNLVGNAMDAVHTLVPEERWIRLDAEVDEKLIRIRVANGGPPIPEGVQRRMFQRGFSTKGNAGSGIGLFVSRRIAQEAGGSLVYEREAKHPSFVVVVPHQTESYGVTAPPQASARKR